MFLTILLRTALAFGGPIVAVITIYFAVGSRLRFIPQWVWIALILGLFLAWGIVLFWKWYSARKKAKTIETVILRQAQASADSATPARREEIQEVRKNFEEAVATLKKGPQGKRTLYAIPWYMIIGEPGGGKTTAIKILLGMARPTSGRVLVFGLPAETQQASVEIRRRTGFVSEDKELDDHMTVAEIIRFTRGFYPGWRDDLERQYLRTFELPLDRRVKKLSRGTRTKLALLLALSRGARLLILDEPTAGLDPAVTEGGSTHLAGVGVCLEPFSHDHGRLEGRLEIWLVPCREHPSGVCGLTLRGGDDMLHTIAVLETRPIQAA